MCWFVSDIVGKLKDKFSRDKDSNSATPEQQLSQRRDSLITVYAYRYMHVLVYGKIDLVKIEYHISDYLSCVERKPVYSGFPTTSDTNWAVQPQKMVRGLKFFIIRRRGIVLSM